MPSAFYFYAGYWTADNRVILVFAIAIVGCHLINPGIFRFPSLLLHVFKKRHHFTDEQGKSDLKINNILCDAIRVSNSLCHVLVRKSEQMQN